jgi:S-methylmethionine-dependent homocysteine/selenocysteine methylase
LSELRGVRGLKTNRLDGIVNGRCDVSYSVTPNHDARDDSVIQQFKQRLVDGEVIVIDGGMGPELARRGVDMHPVAWAAPAVLEHPDVVRAAHGDYIKAGAEVIITNTFMAGYHALRAAGLGDRAAEINRRSVEVAREARDDAARAPTLIAGALFPGYFGCEQHGMIPQVSDQELRAALQEQATVLAEAGVDLLALEMIPTGKWGHLALETLSRVGLPVWVGVSYGRLEGTDILMPFDPSGAVGKQVAQIVEDTKADVMAVNVMHTEVDDVASSIDDVKRHWDGVLGAYPHHGTHEGNDRYVPLPISPNEYAARARKWVEHGVQLVGGCCGIGPEHIRALRDGLPRYIPSTKTGLSNRGSRGGIAQEHGGVCQPESPQPRPRRGLPDPQGGDA